MLFLVPSGDELDTMLYFYVCVCMCAHTQLLSHVQLFAAPWTVACLAPQSMGFFRQEYWSRLPFSPPGYLPSRRIEPASPALAGRFFTTGTL